jgi:hypothetical protein
LDFSGEQAIRTGMIHELRWFKPNLTVVSDGLEQLGANDTTLHQRRAVSVSRRAPDTLVVGVIGLHNLITMN